MTEDVQRHVATFTTAGGIQAQTRDDFLGYPDIVSKMKRCVCALCVSSPHYSREQCTMYTNAGSAIVSIKSNEICKPVCLSKRGVLNMLEKNIRGMLQDLAAAEVRSEQPFTDRPMTLRFSLRRDTQTHAPLRLEPYVLDVFWAKMPDDQIGDLSSIVLKHWTIYTFPTSKYLIITLVENLSYLNTCAQNN